MVASIATMKVASMIEAMTKGRLEGVTAVDMKFLRQAQFAHGGEQGK